MRLLDRLRFVTGEAFDPPSSAGSEPDRSGRGLGSAPGVVEAPVGENPSRRGSVAADRAWRVEATACRAPSPEGLRSAVERLRGELGFGAGDLVGLDTETTGLSGSAFPFVVAMSRLSLAPLASSPNSKPSADEGSSAGRMFQWTLWRPEAELEVLSALFAELEAAPVAGILSFNGASFDLPLLRSRAVRLGLRLPACLRVGAPHIDLLSIGRRLWRDRLRDCRLQTFERERLSRRRHGDIPSAEIPAVFDAVVARPDSLAAMDALRRVALHNRVDVESLGSLAIDFSRTIAEPFDLDMAIRSAKHHAISARPARAVSVLGAAVELELDEVESVGLAASVRAETLVSAMLDLDRWERRLGAALVDAPPGASSTKRREGDSEQLRRWRRVAKLLPRDPRTCEAWAKCLEHRLGDVEEALRVVERSADDDPVRRSRLRRKLGLPVESSPVEAPPDVPTAEAARELAVPPASHAGSRGVSSSTRAAGSTLQAEGFPASGRETHLRRTATPTNPKISDSGAPRELGALAASLFSGRSGPAAPKMLEWRTERKPGKLRALSLLDESSPIPGAPRGEQRESPGPGIRSERRGAGYDEIWWRGPGRSRGGRGKGR